MRLVDTTNAKLETVMKVTGGREKKPETALFLTSAGLSLASLGRVLTDVTGPFHRLKSEDAAMSYLALVPRGSDVQEY